MLTAYRKSVSLTVSRYQDELENLACSASVNDEVGRTFAF
jgi:hypothetical protein